MKPLRDRDQARVGMATLAVIALGATVAFNLDDLPLIGGGVTYRAYFSESAGLASGNEVRVAGVKVGEVTGVGLAGDQVDVVFRVRDTWLGDRTSASIGIKTLLGDKYLDLAPAGGAPLDPDVVIPRERTLAPFDVSEAVGQLSDTVSRIDTDQLAESFEVVAEALADTPPHLRSALDGLSSLSRTISSRDEQLVDLAANASRISGTLADRDGELRRLISDGTLLLGELRLRREAISALLTGTRTLADELRGLVADNTAQLTPTLERLDRVTAVLQRNQDNLSAALASMAPFVRVFGNTVGNGRWFEGYLCGLLPPPIVTDVVQVNPEGCLPPLAAGVR
ncbi:MCE family protein [Umezawaea sp.]|uniref:MCE family protein n=1 Tax=Umezawaea sp. TaxID=1955258 RepID=UPI002ED0BFD2